MYCYVLLPGTRYALLQYVLLCITMYDYGLYAVIYIPQLGIVELACGCWSVLFLMPDILPKRVL